MEQWQTEDLLKWGPKLRVDQGFEMAMFVLLVESHVF